MFCVNCGNKFEGKFCPECGTPAAVPAGKTSTESSPEVKIAPSNGQKAMNSESTYESAKKLKDFYMQLEPIFAQITIGKLELARLCEKKEELLRKAAEPVEIEEVEESPKKSGLLKRAVLGVYTFGASEVAHAVKKKKENEIAEKKKEWAEKSKAQERDNLIEYTKQTMEPSIAAANQRIDSLIQNVKNILGSREFQLCVLTVPEKYQGYNEIMDILEILDVGRADNWKEAMNLYEEDLFRHQMIDLQLEQIDIQVELLNVAEDILRCSEKIHETTMDTNALLMAQLAQTDEMMRGIDKGFRIAMEQMKRTGKDAKRIKRACNFSSFMMLPMFAGVSNIAMYANVLV